MMDNSEKLFREALDLLKKLIKIPSLSKHEDKTAELLSSYLDQLGIPFERISNNILAKNKNYNGSYPTLVLNSHHDTVKVNDGWAYDPFGATVEKDVLYGLGSNDAGASLVSLLHVFIHFYEKDLPYNLVFIASAEEEISGKQGLELVLKSTDLVPNLAIVGEPTEMQMAIAEKGLIVIDATATGKAGHVANQDGHNAIYAAMKDIQWIEKYEFDKKSKFLNKVKLTVSQVQGGIQHNIVPDVCKFVIDCRINELYTFEEFIDIMTENCSSTLEPRSLRLKPSNIPIEHSLVQRGVELGLRYFGSNTMSDQVFFKCPSLKIGPGDTNRSHQADEFIRFDEIKDGIKIYIDLLTNLDFNKKS